MEVSAEVSAEVSVEGFCGGFFEGLCRYYHNFSFDFYESIHCSDFLLILPPLPGSFSCSLLPALCSHSSSFLPPQDLLSSFLLPSHSHLGAAAIRATRATRVTRVYYNDSCSLFARLSFSKKKRVVRVIRVAMTVIRNDNDNRS